MVVDMMRKDKSVITLSFPKWDLDSRSEILSSTQFWTRLTWVAHTYTFTHSASRLLSSTTTPTVNLGNGETMSWTLYNVSGTRIIGYNRSD